MLDLSISGFMIENILTPLDLCGCNRHFGAGRLLQVGVPDS